MNKMLGHFLISDARRSETLVGNVDIFQGFTSIYESLHNFKRYCYFFYELFSKNKVNLVVIEEFPHSSIDLILAYTSEYFKIKTRMCIIG